MRKALVVVVFIAGATTAHADEAADWFERGRVQKEQGDLVGACESFEKSYALEQAPGTALNVADCEERAGNWQYALELYEGAATVFERSESDTRARYARKRAEQLRAAHAPKPTSTPAAPQMEPEARDRTWLYIGLGATTLSVLGIAGVVYSYHQMAEFQDAQITGEVIWDDPNNSQYQVTQDDCGHVRFAEPSLNEKFSDACAAKTRAKWLFPATLGTGII